MTSISARLVTGALRALGAKRVWSDADRARAHLEKVALRPPRYGPPRLLRNDVHVVPERRAGWPVYTITPVNATPRGALVYVHGGGWVNDIFPLHWRTAAKIAAEAQTTVILPLYPLVPFATAGEVIPEVADVVREARAEHGRVALGGDSSGGQIALSTAQVLRDAGDPPLELTLLISPALDLTISNPEIPHKDQLDPWLGVDGSRVFIAEWAGDLPLDDPWVSPLAGRFDGLGPVLLFSGTHDVLDPDARILLERLRAAGVPVTFHEAGGLMHVYPLMPVAEGKRAREIIVAAVREALARP